MTYTFGAKSGTSKLDRYKNKLSSYVLANIITAKQPGGRRHQCLLEGSPPSPKNPSKHTEDKRRVCS